VGEKEGDNKVCRRNRATWGRSCDMAQFKRGKQKIEGGFNEGAEWKLDGDKTHDNLPSWGKS